MSGRIVACVGGVFAVAFLTFVNIAQKREEYWRPVLDDIAERAGTDPMKFMYVVPGKGCGWSFGETVHAWTEMGDVRTEIVMCRSRHGVRFDINTYESQWIRGGPA